MVHVLGAGIAGLTAARALLEARQDAVLFESAPSLGGLTRSVVVGDDSFDYTGHFLHLSGCSRPSQLPLAGLDDRDWMRHVRRAVCWFDGHFITAPIQYHLSELGATQARQCLESYEQRPRDAEPRTLRDYLIAGFGQELAEKFLIPLNEKTLAISADRLLSSAATRFFPHPDEARIRASMPGEKAVDETVYNAAFWYPRCGGIELLPRRLSAGLEASLRLQEPAQRLELGERRLHTPQGSTQYDELFSSLPLPRLCALSDDETLRGWGKALTHSTTICVNVALEASLSRALQGIHWVYVADPAIEFYRLGFYSNVQPGGSSVRLFAEIGCAPQQAGEWLRRDLISLVVDRLNDLGWISGQSVRCGLVYPIEHAYVHFTEERERLLPLIVERLRQSGVHVLGRYGAWDHMSMEDCIRTSMSKVGQTSRV
jgi:protoporphyrinogen oxidase